MVTLNASSLGFHPHSDNDNVASRHSEIMTLRCRHCDASRLLGSDLTKTAKDLPVSRYFNPELLPQPPTDSKSLFKLQFTGKLNINKKTV